MKKLKILYVIDTLYNAGAEKSLLEITRNFSTVIPVFVHIYEENALKNEFLKDGITVHSLNVTGPWNLKMAVQELKKIYELEQPDVVHATLFRSEIVTRKLKKIYPEIPLINSFVSDSYSSEKLRNEPFLRKVKGKFIQTWDTWTARKVDYFISNSETIKLSMSRTLNVPLKKVKVIYRGRDLAKLVPSANDNNRNILIDQLNLQGKTILLNVGRLIESKGQKDIIEIMPRLLKEHPNSVLLVAGEGLLRNQLEILIIKNGLQKNVVLLGNRPDIPDLLDLADIFVFPTYIEGLPGALIEAMMSKPVICCSDIPVNLECVNDESAVIFEVGNRNDLFEKLNFTISNLPSLQVKSDNAINIAAKKFDINQISRAYEKFYRDVVADQNIR